VKKKCEQMRVSVSGIQDGETHIEHKLIAALQRFEPAVLVLCVHEMRAKA
jgi:hypothetical protein